MSIRDDSETPSTVAAMGEDDISIQDAAPAARTDGEADEDMELLMSVAPQDAAERRKAMSALLRTLLASSTEP